MKTTIFTQTPKPSNTQTLPKKRSNNLFLFSVFVLFSFNMLFGQNESRFVFDNITTPTYTPVSNAPFQDNSCQYIGIHNNVPFNVMPVRRNIQRCHSDISRVIRVRP